MFKHFPLSFHKNAHLAHQASIEAQEQGGLDKFWAYHDKLFENQSNLKREHLIQYAQQIGLDVARFTQALDTQKHKARVDADIQEGGEVGVQGTPSVYVNGIKADGFEFDKLKKQVDPILIKKGYKPSEFPDKPSVNIALANVASIGPKDAPVTIVEYSDFE